MNLYEETLAKLSEYGKTLDDIVAICGSEFRITKDDFVRYAKTDYDNGYGAPEVATDLRLVGVDFWLERCEYDGSEWWDFKQIPNYSELPFMAITAMTIGQANSCGVNCSCGWETLARLNKAPTSINHESLF